MVLSKVNQTAPHKQNQLSIKKEVDNKRKIVYNTLMTTKTIQYTLEWVRTITALLVLVLQLIILSKIL